MKKKIISLVFVIVSMQSFAQWPGFSLDTITFESGYEYLSLDTSADNIWQIGQPSKVFFDSAFSAPNAIVTDTLLNYPVNVNSHFDLYIGEYNFPEYPYNIAIQIQHKFDTDTLKDGCFISVSYDYGENWMNIIHDTVYPEATPSWDNYNLYTEGNTLFNGEFGFSGRSDGWDTTIFSWHYIPVESWDDIGDTMIVRFNFISDSIDSEKEGWMIDNIRLFEADLPGGIHNMDMPGFNIYPIPAKERFVIVLPVRNTGNYQNSLSDHIIEIYDLQGREVKKIKVSQRQKKINVGVEGWKKGVYFVHMFSKEGFSETSKVIVK